MHWSYPMSYFTPRTNIYSVFLMKLYTLYKFEGLLSYLTKDFKFATAVFLKMAIYHLICVPNHHNKKPLFWLGLRIRVGFSQIRFRPSKKKPYPDPTFENLRHKCQYNWQFNSVTSLCSIHTREKKDFKPWYSDRIRIGPSRKKIPDPDQTFEKKRTRIRIHNSRVDLELMLCLQESIWEVQRLRKAASFRNQSINTFLGVKLLYELVCLSLIHSQPHSLMFLSLSYIIQYNGYRTFFV